MYHMTVVSPVAIFPGKLQAAQAFLAIPSVPDMGDGKPVLKVKVVGRRISTVEAVKPPLSGKVQMVIYMPVMMAMYTKNLTMAGPVITVGAGKIPTAAARNLVIPTTASSKQAQASSAATPAV